MQQENQLKSCCKKIMSFHDAPLPSSRSVSMRDIRGAKDASLYPGLQISGMTSEAGGFTLIELLVVVLIIGILAAVALPQYQKTILKSQYSTLKDRARTLAQAQQRYHLTNGTYAEELAELDIDFAITQEQKNESSFFLYFRDGTRCEIYFGANNRAECGKVIFGKWIFYERDNSGEYSLCSTNSTNTNDMFNKLCQNETGANSYCSETKCYYSYNS